MRSRLDIYRAIPDNEGTMNEKDLRKEYRIPAAELPAEYTRFTILLGDEDMAEVQTTDLSLNGFGFLTRLPPETFIAGSRLVLYPLGEDRPVYGIVVHAAATDRGTRIGVKLQELGGYAEYSRTIQKILSDLDAQTGS